MGEQWQDRQAMVMTEKGKQGKAGEEGVRHLRRRQQLQHNITIESCQARFAPVAAILATLITGYSNKWRSRGKREKR